MKILLFHMAVIPPKDYGGTERVVQYLAKGLVELGHTVGVVCLEGSTFGPEIQCYPVSDVSEGYSVLKGLFKSYEVVHFMSTPQLPDEQIMLPWLVTIHGNGRENEVFAPRTVFVSRDHALRHGRKTFVYNGIDPCDLIVPEFERMSCEQPSLAKNKRNYLLFLSKTNWKVKNLSGAISYSRFTKTPLWIAGGNRPYWLKFWVGLSRLWGGRLRWIGPVSGQRKALLLAQAQALVFPVNWSEPFGLVVAEALFCGTPVFCSPNGSLPELVTAEVGMICTSESDWKAAVSMVGRSYSPVDCYAYAESKFHYHIMVKNYLALYQRVIEGERYFE